MNVASTLQLFCDMTTKLKAWVRVKRPAVIKASRTPNYTAAPSPTLPAAAAATAAAAAAAAAAPLSRIKPQCQSSISVVCKSSASATGEVTKSGWSPSWPPMSHANKSRQREGPRRVFVFCISHPLAGVRVGLAIALRPREKSFLIAVPRPPSSSSSSSSSSS